MVGGMVEVRDYVLWPKHIHGDATLRDELLALDAGAVVTLDIGGVVGTWAKMAAGKHGMPTPGLRALGQARTHWHGLFQNERGAVLPIRKP
ncbi:hypothetical protein ACFOD4_04685 [Pseudoroseomonas globiformis]|uniref:Uncharacterized protein n=1 Tax=Teichococcus globiformis TaxID=2307229 RepID=A0ABV7FVE3_9PROT